MKEGFYTVSIKNDLEHRTIGVHVKDHLWELLGYRTGFKTEELVIINKLSLSIEESYLAEGEEGHE